MVPGVSSDFFFSFLRRTFCYRSFYRLCSRHFPCLRGGRELLSPCNNFHGGNWNAFCVAGDFFVNSAEGNLDDCCMEGNWSWLNRRHFGDRFYEREIGSWLNRRQFCGRFYEREIGSWLNRRQFCDRFMEDNPGIEIPWGSCCFCVFSSFGPSLLSRYGMGSGTEESISVVAISLSVILYSGLSPGSPIVIELYN